MINLTNKIFRNFSHDISHQNMPQRLKRKFYKHVDIAEVKNKNFDPNNKIDNKNTFFDKLTNFSELKENYYHILLDNKKCKSMYLDEYKIPNKNLALILAEEWASQKENVNLHSMQLNFYASSGIRISNDNLLREDIVKNISNFINSDQICFIEDKIINFINQEENENLSFLINKIFEFMKENFDIEMKMDTSFKEGLITYDSNTGDFNFNNKEKFRKLLDNLDPWVLATLEPLIGMTKSPSVSLALLCNVITARQAFLLSHSEEYYQMKINGEVEGHHDINHEVIMGKFYSALVFNNINFI